MIELYTAPTANGQKASIMLEEVGLPYRSHVIDLQAGGHQAPDFLSINPIGKVPVVIDPDPPGGGEPLTVAETTAIVMYLAEKAGKLIPDDLQQRAMMHQWLAIVSSDIGPAFTGEFIFGHLMPEKIPFAIQHYDKEVKRYLAVMEKRLSESPFLAGPDYTVADVLAYPVAATSAQRTADKLEPYPHIARWAAGIGERPAVQRGMQPPS